MTKITKYKVRKSHLVDIKSGMITNKSTPISTETINSLCFSVLKTKFSGFKTACGIFKHGFKTRGDYYFKGL